MNNMNQFGNNLNAPYGQNDYSQFFYGKNQYGQQQQQNMNNLLWVQGIEGAKALMLPPNAKIICLDSETENRAYIKVADELGATKLRKEAEQYHLNKVAVGYDIVYIIEEQDKNV